MKEKLSGLPERPFLAALYLDNKDESDPPVRRQTEIIELKLSISFLVDRGY